MASSKSLFDRIGVTSKSRETVRTTKKSSLTTAKSSVNKPKASVNKNKLADNSLFQAISGIRKTGNFKNTNQQAKKKNELIVKSIDSSVFKDKKVTAPTRHDSKRNNSDKSSDSNNRNGSIRRGRNKDRDSDDFHVNESTDNRKRQQQTQASDRQSGSRRDQRHQNTNNSYQNRSHNAVTTASNVSNVAVSSYPTMQAQPAPLPSSSSMQFHYPHDINPSYNRPGMGHSSNPHSFSIRNASLPPILVLRNLAPGTSMADVRVSIYVSFLYLFSY